MYAPCKLETELVDVEGNGVVVGFIGGHHFVWLIECRDFAQRTGNARDGAGALFGLG